MSMYMQFFTMLGMLSAVTATPIPKPAPAAAADGTGVTPGTYIS